LQQRLFFEATVEVGYYVVQPGNTPNDPQINGAVLTKSVVRIFCIGQTFYGTGFLHKSGNVITAGHIVVGCNAANVEVRLPDGTETGITKWQESNTVDLAVLYPQVPMNWRSVVDLSQTDDVNIGEQVDFWSFPTGSENLAVPILTVGYLGGVDPHPLFEAGQVTAPLWVINANVNPGSSGAPVVRVSDGSIIGVIVGKSRRSDGIGYIVPVSTLRAFLQDKDIGIAP
jgi:S1-C subfamily serine protease